MWIFTSRGFVSCVQHKDDPSKILIRARSKEHVLAFIGYDKESRYFHLENCDYNHRAELTRDEFTERLIEHVNRISYPDFKGSIPKGAAYRSYYHACHDVWKVMDDFKHGQYEPGELNGMQDCSMTFDQITEEIYGGEKE